MITRFQHSKITWLDVVHPTPEEVREILTECKLPPEFGADLSSMIPHPETRMAKKAVKVTLDFPIVKRTDINHPHEIKFIATPTHVVTVRYEDIEVLHRFSKELEVSALNKRSHKHESGVTLFLSLLLYVYRGLDLKLDYLESLILTVEENIARDNEKEMLFQISTINRKLITFKHTVAGHDRALEEMRAGVLAVFGDQYKHSLDEISVVLANVLHRTSVLSSTLQDLRDTNGTLLTAKQNEVMKTLTIMAFVTFPLTLFTSLFGMNTTNTPLVEDERGFWYVVLIMVLASIGFFWYFKHRKWI